jgi:glycosyltransferase involved in cell wall biosynthesis
LEKVLSPKSMRLLVVTQYFWPENFRINDLVAELVNRGHQVTVLTGLPNYPEGKVFQGYSDNPQLYSNYKGADVVRVPMMPRGDGGLKLILNYLTFAASASILGMWKLRGRQFDAIFAYEPSPITVGLPASLMRTVKQAPLVFWVLDLWPETLQAIGVVRSRAVLYALEKLVTFIYKRCDLILAQSKTFVPQIKKYAGINHCVEYFPSWAEDCEDLQTVVPAKEVLVKPRVFNVMFAGNIGEAQDFPAILAAAEILKYQPNICWLIVGDGRLAGWVADEIKARGLESCVFLLGRFPAERMSSFFKHADSLLVSLKNEPIFSLTIPAKLQSYLVAGKPVLAMINGEGARVINESGSGISCPAGDSQALANSVLKLFSISAKEREEMGRKGLEYSNREFNRRFLIDKLVVMLEQTQIAKSDRKAKGL